MEVHVCVDFSCVKCAALNDLFPRHAAEICNSNGRACFDAVHYCMISTAPRDLYPRRAALYSVSNGSACWTCSQLRDMCGTDWIRVSFAMSCRGPCMDHPVLWVTVADEPAGKKGLYGGDAALSTLASQWEDGAKMRIEWGSSSFIEFLPASDPFVARPTQCNGQKSCNILITLSEFSTSDSNLQSWVSSAGGAWLCIGTTKGWDTAWAVIPVDNNKWQIGCNNGSWAGRGAFYGEEHCGGGWVGVADNGHSKAGNGNRVGMKLKLYKSGS